ncbi:DUF2752 domain-containing protein [Flavobacterium sp.]|uniref:DUF2752 domain-containing protein n=1 Tax=Flavobacterium sp. TaxID=239 RepID=UPI003527FEF6
MKKNKLYFFLLSACFLGFCWLYFAIHYEKNNTTSVCFIKNTTSIPCPSCGSTRAVLELSKGNIVNAILINPFGLFIALGLLLIPFWILIDMLLKKDSFYQLYQKIEKIIQKKPIAIILIILVLLNWFWNIKKGL